MLIDFTFKNCLSYRDETSFSMLTGKFLKKHASNKFSIDKTSYTENLNLLKNIIIFGPNGSGKSNLIIVLRQMKNRIFSKPKFSTTELTQFPFALDENSNTSPTHFSIEIISNNRQYLYEFEYNKEEITFERLKYYYHGHYHTYFERNHQNFSLSEELNIQSDSIRKNVLVLQVAQDTNDTHAKNIYDWFANKLVIIDDILDSSDIQHMQKVLNNQDTKEELIKFLNLCDVKVKDLDTTIHKEPVPKFIQQYIEFLNNNDSLEGEIEETAEFHQLNLVYDKFNQDNKPVGQQRISFANESNGTKKLITIAFYLLNNRNKDCVFLMYEFDDSLHLNLAQILVQVFNNSINQQFILTSHQLYLLDCNLRKDQIYLTDKKFNGASELFSVFDFNDDDLSKRTDTTYFKRYLKGIYGAVPNVDFSDFKNLFNTKNQGD